MGILPRSHRKIHPPPGTEAAIPRRCLWLRVFVSFVRRRGFRRAARRVGGGAPETITSLNVSTTGTASTVDGLTYNNTTQAVTGFADALGASYSVISSADNTAAQRNGTPNQSSAWYAISCHRQPRRGQPDQLPAPAQVQQSAGRRGQRFLQRHRRLRREHRAARLHLERPALQRQQLAFAVFERGLAGAHDAFTIAIVTAISPTTHPRRTADT